MQLSTEHILTTHAGSLPRPDDVARMLYDLLPHHRADNCCYGGTCSASLLLLGV
jgi:hypothetical protein